MRALLERAGYVFNEEHRIWIGPDYGGIAYSDGDEVEQRIARAIRLVGDVSVLSTELRQHCIDWPSLYHLGSLRSNLMRPFATVLRDADVLEIGAGCGAITRYMGEAGANVLALEGSPRRAAIARSRTRELENVTVLSERFDQFKCGHQFDVITLIGVLEYANMFTEGEQPPLHMLQRVRSLLKPGGRLIIAIENQLGLKYFAGAPEDHLGHAMIGIEGRYGPKLPQTFGREVLAQLLVSAGFAPAEFLAPYPDYKLPVSIITEHGFADAGFDAAALAWQSARRDPQMPPLSNFSMELAYPEVIANGLGMDMANSFLVVASPEGTKTVEPNVLAYHYSVDRVPEYCKETRFVRLDEAPVEVLYHRLGTVTEQAGLSAMRFSVPESDEYVFGTVLTLDFVRIVMHDGWTYQQVAAFIRRYMGILAQFGAFTASNEAEPASVYSKIPGRFFDVIPQNIVLRADGSPALIDKEWQLEFPIEVGHLLFRSLLALINTMTRFGRPTAQTVNVTRQQFIDAVLAEVGLPLSEADFVRYIGFEADIQQTVTGRPAALFIDWGQHHPLPMQTLAQAVTERVVEVDHLRFIIGQRDKSIAGLEQSIGEGALQLKQMQQLLADRDAQLLHAQEHVAQREQQVQSLLQVIGERDAIVQAQQQLISERDMMVHSLQQVVSERDALVQSIQHEVGERDVLMQQLHGTVSERDAMVGELQRLLAAQAGPLTEMRRSIDSRDAENGQLRELLRQRDAAFASVINSRSWLMTKPYRWIGRVLRGEFAAAMDPFNKLFGLKEYRRRPLIGAPSEALPASVVAEPVDSDIVDRAPIAPTHSVSVILPVYRGVDMTKRCIEAAMPGVLAVDGAVLLAINDGSPDQGMQAMLESLVPIWPGRFEVLENPINLGFVGTVNRGLAHFPSQDVVLLNSDVIVPADWLKRLQVEAYSHPRVGTVTPFSNNATICSFPDFLEENELAFNLDVHAIDAVFRQSTLPCVAAPTGVGFCMFIRRACLDQIGYLNAEKFGRGYGEENDLCQRALKAGWLNILSPNMFAYHEGGVSFSSDKQALVDNAVRVIDSLHPNYHADVQAFIQRDPVRSARVERYVQLLATLTLPKVLHVSHGSGGGVGQHIEELAEYFDQDAAHLMLAPQDGPAVVGLSLRSRKLTDKLLFAMPADYAKLRNLLEQVGISAVHYHHTLNIDPVLQKLAHDLRATTVLTAHDYYWLNANPTLTAADGRFPGQYLEDLHNPLYPLPPGITASQWRDQLRPLIEQADCLIFPSNATKILFGDMYRLEHAVVTPHVEPHLNVRQAPRQLIPKQHYVIGVLGAIGREKGADMLEMLAQMAQRQDARFSFKLIGYAYRQLDVVETTGPYKAEDLPALIEHHCVDLILFPAQCPETYSYTLSHALASGLPVIAPNLGAFPERLSGRASVMLFDHLAEVAELYRSISEFVSELETGTVSAPVYQGDQSQPEFYTRDYVHLLARRLKPPVLGKPSFEFDAAQIVRGPVNQTGWRHALLRGLWHLHTHPSLRWASSAVPYNLKRAIKRSLSRSPMHDITIKS